MNRQEAILEILNKYRQAVGDGYDHGIGDWDFKNVAEELNSITVSEDVVPVQSVPVIQQNFLSDTEIAKRMITEFMDYWTSLPHIPIPFPNINDFRDWLDSKEGVESDCKKEE